MTTEAGEPNCIICWEVSSPRGPPIRSGCACREESEFSHISCRLKHAVRADGENWYKCPTCEQVFSGEMALVLARERCERTEGLLYEWDEPRISARSELALTLHAEGLFTEAEAVQRDLIAVCTRNAGEDHPFVLSATGNLANILDSLGKHEESEQMIRKVLEAQERIRVDRQDIVWTETILATVLRIQHHCPEKLLEAEKLSRKILKESQELFGIDDCRSIGSEKDLGLILVYQRKFVEAEALLRKVLEAYKLLCGPNHVNTLDVSQELSYMLAELGKCEEAEELARNTLAKSELSLGSEHRLTKQIAKVLAKIVDAKRVSQS